MEKRTQTFVCVVNSVRFIIYTHNDIADYRNIKKWCDGRKLKVVTIIEILRTKLIQSIGVVRYISLLFAFFFFKVRAVLTFLWYSTYIFFPSAPSSSKNDTKEEKKNTRSQADEKIELILYMYFVRLPCKILYFLLHFLCAFFPLILHVILLYCSYNVSTLDELR